MKKNAQKQIRAIIFDMDGTIIDTEHVWANATQYSLIKRGHENLSDDQKDFLSSFAGCGLTHWAHSVKKKFNIDDHHETLVHEAIEQAKLELTQVIPFIEGFQEFYAKLGKYNLKTSVATNADLESFSSIIKTMNFKDFFGEHLYCVDHVGGKAKPDPTLFLHAAKKLGVKPEECLVFEDSAYGFQAAQAAGMRCIAIKKPEKTNRYIEGNLAAQSEEAPLNVGLMHTINNYHEALRLIEPMLELLPEAPAKKVIEHDTPPGP
jgi:beta-phosphoglucomutase-like phosphatase (HAD superfamily)